jgi:hypothetical protein
VSIVMPVVTVVISWLIAFLTAKYIAAKSTKKHAFEELLTCLDQLEESAQALFLVAGNDPIAHAHFGSVRLSDNRLGRRIQEVFESYPSKRKLAGRDPIPFAVSTARIALRRLAVADDLVSAGRPALPATDQKFGELSECVENLRRHLREEASDRCNRDHS